MDLEVSLQRSLTRFFLTGLMSCLYNKDLCMNAARIVQDPERIYGTPQNCRHTALVTVALEQINTKCFLIDVSIVNQL